MIDPVLAFTEGGPFAVAIVLALPLALVVATSMFVVGMINRRPPLAVWLIVPFATLVLAVVGSGYGFQRTLEAVAQAAPEIRERLQANGRGVSLFVEYLAALGLGPLLVLSAWAAGAGGWFAAHHPEATPRDAAATGGIAATTLIVGCLAGLVLGPDFDMAAAPLVAFAAGAPAVVLAASRRGTGELAPTNAEQRIGSAVLLLVGSVLAGLAMQRAGVILTLQALAKASEETRPVLVANGVGQVEMAMTQLAIVAIGSTAMVGWLIQSDRKHIDGRTTASLVAAGGMILVWIGAMALVHSGAPPVDWPSLP